MRTHHTTLGAVLSITTGVLVCPLDDLYSLQDFLVGRSLMTHERVIGWKAQADALLEQFPALAEAEPSRFDKSGDVERQCRDWVASVARHVGFDTCEVRPVAGLEVDPAEGFDYLLSRLGATR